VVAGYLGSLGRMLIHLTASRSLALVAATVFASGAQALCLDPRNLDRYYRPSLEQEVKTADAIVVGTVVHVQRLKEDKTDPEGWTSFIYAVRVKKSLRGNTPTDIALSASNDSGGYRMSAGETHLLFLSRRGTYFTVDPCGNSRDLHKDRTAVHRVTSVLQSKRDAP
jgi:hypothetical protein